MTTLRQRIVDAHVHLWDLEANHYPWLVPGVRAMAVDCGGYESIKRNYLPDDLRSDAKDLDIVGLVHIQANIDPSDHVRETRWLQGIADGDKAGMPQGIVANVDLQLDGCARILEAHCGFANMRGIRQILHKGARDARPYNPLQDAKWRANFGLLARHGLSFDVHALAYQAADVVELMKVHEDVTFVITHCGLPLWPDEASLELWRNQLRAYAQQPNAFLKISGLGLFDLNWTTDSARSRVMDCVDAFGPRRCILASNYPVETLARPYHDVWTSYLEMFSGFSETERDDLFCRNAERVYRLTLNQ